MQQQNTVQLARLIAAVIVVVGILFAIWNASDLGSATKSQAFRYFVDQSLTWIFYGAILLVAAEAADRLGTRRAP